MAYARLAADIGGTFTDIAVESENEIFTCKVLTTPQAPENGVFDGITRVLDQTGLSPSDFGSVIHGTTLATNAIIERKGARTAMIVTEGFRDSIEIGYENRFEQYDIFINKPPPLVPRELRFGVTERMDARGNVLIPLEEAALGEIIESLRLAEVQSVAVGLLHSYIDDRHERKVAEILSKELPQISITLSSEVSPEIREFDRWSTASANAYVQPLMSSYLGRLNEKLGTMGFDCPLCMMTSGGGIAAIEIARQFPIRLVESGPAGGAILAAQIAGECGLDEVLSFDMGGTTAKICLIDGGEPQQSRTFEVARQYRFMKGSGLPLRIPVIEMVEIGAGGGSIASVDTLSRIHVGPESAGSEPGPACYDRGGVAPTVTDADAVLGRIDPDSFAAGTIPLNVEFGRNAIQEAVGAPLDLSVLNAAFGISEIVEENMANAARVHAVERGKELENRTMIAFGGAAPVHAVRLARSLGIERIVIPTAAGVGSAIGFLRAPVAFEVVRSRYTLLDETFDADALNAIFAAMRREAEDIVSQAAPEAELIETRTADMRYCGQGHEISFTLPPGPYDVFMREQCSELFTAAYETAYGRHIPNVEIEVLNWTLRLSAYQDPPTACPDVPVYVAAESASSRDVFDPDEGTMKLFPVYQRRDLRPGMIVQGPAIISEDETTSVVNKGYVARINGLGYIVISKESP
jgi:N-methylhydantoinase A